MSIEPKAGLIGLTHGTGAISRAIRIGQAIRFEKSDSYYNHAFLMVDDFNLIEMGGHGAQARTLGSYTDTPYILLDPATKGDEADIGFAQWALEHHSGYGFATIASLTLSLLTGAGIEFGIKGTMICSGMVAACLDVDMWRADPSHVMPAELAARYL